MSTQSRIAAEAQKDPETLEREIDQQRESISSIVHELENKLSPGELLDRALRYAKGNGGEFFGNLGETVKANPVPTLLTALGLTWLMMGQNRSASASGHASLSDQAAGAKRQAQHLKDKAGQLREELGSNWDSTRQRLSDSSHQAADTLRHQAERARDGVEHMLAEQPLALGAIGIAVGALLGAALPPTRQEDRLLGETSDRLTDKAKALAEEGYAKASEVSQELSREVADRVRQDGRTHSGIQ